MDTPTPIKDYIESIFKTGAGGAQKNKMRIGLAGSGPMFEAMARAYHGQPCAESIVLFCPVFKRKSGRNNAPPNAAEIDGFDEFIAAVDAAEIFGAPEPERNVIAHALLKAGKHVSLQKPFAANVGDAERLIFAARATGAFLRVNEPALFYSPYRKLKQLIDDMEIGEICAVRIHANLCGDGGWGPMAELLKGNPLLHPAFDVFALSTFLVGEPESVNAYIPPFSVRKGGRAVIGVKYKSPGCYGSFDLTYAPQTSIRSNGIPCEDIIEIAGTDGIIWARHFHGKMTEEPWIEVRRGKKHYTLGIGSGLDLAWDDALRASAKHFLSRAAAGKQPQLAGDNALSALRFLLAAETAARTNEEIRL